MSMLLFPGGGGHSFPYHDFYRPSFSTDASASFHLRRALQQQRQQQSLQLPNYTSPPTEQALLATPEAYRSDAVINQGRSAAAAGQCNASDYSVCQIIFIPPTSLSSSSSSSSTSATTDAQMGVVFYGGALVDPRAYSPLALTLSTRYGLPTVIPIFAQDLAWSPLQTQCASGRVALAQAAVPSVQTWILVGHSAGGLAAQLDAFAWYMNATKTSSSSSSPPLVGGLVLLGSYISNQVLCDNRTVDFSKTTFPMAVLDGSNDEIVNHTNFEQGFAYVPANTTYSLIIIGGNHAGFGSYNDSLRTPILHQTDGIPTIPPVSQWDSSTSAIYNVVARASSTGSAGGASLPPIPSSSPPTASPPSTNPTTSQAYYYYGGGGGARALHHGPFSMPKPWLGGTEMSWTLSIVLLFWMLRRSYC